MMEDGRLARPAGRTDYCAQPQLPEENALAKISIPMPSPKQTTLLQLSLSPLNSRDQNNVGPRSSGPARRLILADLDAHQKRDQIVVRAHPHDLGVRAARVGHEYDLEMWPRVCRPRIRRDPDGAHQLCHTETSLSFLMPSSLRNLMYRRCCTKLRAIMKVPWCRSQGADTAIQPRTQSCGVVTKGGRPVPASWGVFTN